MNYAHIFAAKTYIFHKPTHPTYLHVSCFASVIKLQQRFYVQLIYLAVIIYVVHCNVSQIEFPLSYEGNVM